MSGTEADRYDVYLAHANGYGVPDLLYRSGYKKYPTDWSRDGRFLLFNAIQGAKSAIWAVSLADHHATAVIETVASEGYGAVSPDGKWLAFQSHGSGQAEVFVQAFAGTSAATSRRWLVSMGGGGLPRWRGDGKELYYLTGRGTMMAVEVHPKGDEFQSESPRELFQTHPIPFVWNLFDVTPDGQRFLVNVPLEWASSPAINVLTNWPQHVRR
jgi:Tol biopolymer transport system component